MRKTKLLAGGSAIAVAAMAMAGSAGAVTMVYGGGSTLIAPYIRQAEDCYGNRVPLVNQGSSLNTPGNDTLVTLNYFDYTGSPAQNCATQTTDPTTTLSYIGAGSGNGIAAFYGHDPVTYWGDTSGGSPGNTYWPSVQYGASDAGLSATDIANYNCVGSTDCVESKPVEAVNGVKTTYTVTIIGSTSGTVASGTTYKNPTPLYGPAIQVPLLVAPVAIAYSSAYKVVTNASDVATFYHFNIKSTYKNKDGSGGLRLDMATVCAIFNGQITNWNDPALKALNGGTSLQDPNDPAGASGWATTGLPIELVGRSDSSGTTSIFYRAIAAQCNGGGTEIYTEDTPNITYSNQYQTGGSKTLPSGLQGTNVYTGGDNITGYSNDPGHFTLATGSSGIAAYLNFIAGGSGSAHDIGASSSFQEGRLAYLGPDYALPAVTNTGDNNFGLNVADLKEIVGTAYKEPTGTNAVKAFGTGASAILPPQSTSSGAYTATPGATSLGCRAYPQDWAEPISTTLNYVAGTGTCTQTATSGTPTPLANPTAAGAYPIVGTTDGFVYTCYNGAAVTTSMVNFFKYYFTSGTLTSTSTLHPGVLASAGLAPVPPAWRTAIKATFFSPIAAGPAATKQLNLYVLQATTGPVSGTGSQCHVATPGA